jgi:hypothetical protein
MASHKSVVPAEAGTSVVCAAKVRQEPTEIPGDACPRTAQSPSPWAGMTA